MTCALSCHACCGLQETASMSLHTCRRRRCSCCFTTQMPACLSQRQRLLQLTLQSKIHAGLVQVGHGPQHAVRCYCPECCGQRLSQRVQHDLLVGVTAVQDSGAEQQAVAPDTPAGSTAWQFASKGGYRHSRQDKGSRQVMRPAARGDLEPGSGGWVCHNSLAAGMHHRACTCSGQLRISAGRKPLT